MFLHIRYHNFTGVLTGGYAMHIIDKTNLQDGNEAAQGLIMLLLRRYFSADEQLYYVETPHLDIVRAGQTPQIAQAVFDEAIAIQIEEWETRGILRKCLLELGFRVSHNGMLDMYCAPETLLSASPENGQVSAVSVASELYSATSGAPFSA